MEKKEKELEVKKGNKKMKKSKIKKLNKKIENK